MATVATLILDIQAEIPELPSFIAQRQFLRAAREFCQQTRVWRSENLLSVVAGTATYSVGGLVPSNTELVDFLSVKNEDGGAPLSPTTYAWLDENTSDWRDDTADDAKWYIFNGNNFIRLIPTPATTQLSKYHLRFAVTPLLTSTTIDDRVANKYRETLIHGALGYLYMIPRKPWTDFALGQSHNTLFMNAIPSASSEASDDFHKGVHRKVKYGGL